MQISKLLRGVPPYKEFMTVNELNFSSTKLAEDYPNIVTQKVVGSSVLGEEIKLLEIGEGEKTALLFAFPHPHEPIGSLTLEYLSTLLAKNHTLREKLGFKWLIIKCIDPDGARLNEGWFKGKFTPLKFALNYYRPPSNEQVEWTFPIHYKTLHWDKPLPETKILMHLIEEYKPNFMYSLHNAGFCGVYFYVTHNFPSLFKKFRELVRAEELPLHLGEPEMPYIKKLGDAIFEEFGTAKAYDFYQQYGCKDPAELLDRGTSSFDYLRRYSPTGFSLVCEMPYYYDSRISSSKLTSVRRRKTILKQIEILEQNYQFLKPIWLSAIKYVPKPKESKLYRSFKDYIKKFPILIKSLRLHAKTAKEYEGKATVAQWFDTCVAPKFSQLKTMGLCLRAIRELFAQANKRKKHYLGRGQKKIYQKILMLNAQFCKQTNFKVIPIQRLVRVQLGSALYAVNTLIENSRHLV